MSGYLRPVDPINGRICTYYTHTRRTTPSSEAGVDYYCPIGTPIRAAGNGVIYEIGGGIQPATGRFTTIDLDDGRRVRYLHLSRWAVFKGRVTRGQIIGYSGASGYGSEYFGATSPNTIPTNTGGPHVHTTLWPGHYYQFGRYPLQPTLDFEKYVDQPTETEFDMRAIHSPSRPWRLIAPGYTRVLNEEEAGNTIWPKHDLNDRQYDLAVATSVGTVDTQPVGGMVIVEDSAKTRPVALLGPGYYRALNDEESANAAILATRRVVGNTRQYDLWVSIALAGQGASFPVAQANLSALSDEDVRRLASAAADEQDRRARERLTP